MLQRILLPLVLMGLLYAVPTLAQDVPQSIRDRVKAIRDRHTASAAPDIPHLPKECEKTYGRPHPHCTGALELAMDPQHGDPQVVQAILTAWPDHAAEMQRNIQVVNRVRHMGNAIKHKLATMPLDEHTVTHTWTDHRGRTQTSTTTCTFYQSKTECHTR